MNCTDPSGSDVYMWIGSESYYGGSSLAYTLVVRRIHLYRHLYRRWAQQSDSIFRPALKYGTASSTGVYGKHAWDITLREFAAIHFPVRIKLRENTKADIPSWVWPLKYYTDPVSGLLNFLYLHCMCKYFDLSGGFGTWPTPALPSPVFSTSQLSSSTSFSAHLGVIVVLSDT